MCVLLPTTVFAQFKEGDPGGAPLGESRTQKWQAGMTVTAAGGACKGIVGYVPVPVDWPEQKVRIAEENISPGTKIDYQMVDGTVKVMVVRMPFIAPGQTMQALVTFEVDRSSQLPPADTSNLVLPDSRKLPRDVRPYLGPSPKIEVQNAKIRSTAKEILAAVDKTNAWATVEAIYDWVREHVEYKEGPLKGAVAALDDKTGDCEDMSSLFIALCRVSGIPARTVWVPGHCYPEFYLMDEKGEGHWFPCQAAGARAFGGIPEFKPVLQKGDNFRPPWDRKDRQRYMAEHMTGAGGTPQVKFIRKEI